MIIAGEASGDALAAELVVALRSAFAERDAEFTSDAQPLRGSLDPRFFGVGGERMAAAGVEIIFDLAKNAVFGLEALGRLLEYRRRFAELLRLAIAREPDLIVCVDFAGFNRRFAHAVKQRVRAQQRHAFVNWSPKIIQYVSPQVWASRPGRADKMAKDVDALLAIFPFEKAWYARRVPTMHVEFVGHPVVERYAAPLTGADKPAPSEAAPRLVMLPGSRRSELQRHLPILGEALNIIRATKPGVRAAMVLSDSLASVARQIGVPAGIEIRSDLAATLAQSDVAIAKSGTITLECAVFGLPTVAMYKTSALTYAVARRILTVKWIAMPNILANEEVFPEFVQHDATPESLARATLEFLNDPARRSSVQTKLREIVASLGGGGASRRAAEAVVRLMEPGGR